MSPAVTETASGMDDPNIYEIGHYVVTAQPSGSVMSAVKCSFLAPDSIVRSRLFLLWFVDAAFCVPGLLFDLILST